MMNEQGSTKKNDTLWFSFYILLALAIIYFIWSGILLSFNINMPYIAGFVQFGIFASAGELASGRILQKKWTVDSVFIFKGISWAIPFFWIPSNVILFLLPSAVRIIIAALLSFAFGIFMAVLTLRERKKGDRIR